MKRFSFVMLVLLAVSLRAQSPLATLFASNNQGAPGGMVYFDLDVQAAAGVTVTQLDLNLAAAGAYLEVYVTTGSYVSSAANPAAWNLAARGPVELASVDQPSIVCLGPGIHLPQGLYGFAVRGAGAVHRYTNSASAQSFTSAELQLTAGAASNQPFGGAQYAPRLWNGAVHYLLGVGGVGTCAWTERIGAGCYSGATTFYEQFSSLGVVDLFGSTAVPEVVAATAAGPTGYVVTIAASQWYTPQGAPVLDNAFGLLGDDDVSQPLALPFVFSFPGGSTNLVHATANGEVYLGATSLLTADVTPSGAELTTQHPRLAPLWCDLEPLANVPTNSASGVYFDVAANGSEVYVTWFDVADGRGGAPQAGSTSVSVQCVLRSDGSFEFRYGDLQAGPGTGRAVVGFGPGGQAPDPGSRDLDQSLPFATNGPDRYPLEHACTPPSLGSAMTFEVFNVEASSIAFVILGNSPLSGGVDLGFVGAPGCRAYTNVLSNIVLAVMQPAGVGSYSLLVPSSSSLIGSTFTSQAVAPSSSNSLSVTTSNGMGWKVGN